MKPARFFLGMAFAISFGGALISILILIQIAWLMPSFWQHKVILDDPMGNWLRQQASLVYRDMVPVVLAPVIAVILVFCFDRSQWKTGLGKLTMFCLVAYFVSLGILFWPMLSVIALRH
jgi:hypothetical protein